MQCPPHAFLYNGTRCSCNPGHLYNSTQNTCTLFQIPDSAFHHSNGVHYDSPLPFVETVLPLNSISRITISQSVFLVATLVLLGIWLGFCVFTRFFPLGSDGMSRWFRIRWWISRFDVTFASHHWVDDEKSIVKRRTELGGAFSVAAWILFTGLFAALLYQTISNRRVELRNVRATNSPDLASFVNDFAVNITVISAMNCANFRMLDTLVIGNPMSIDTRVVPLSRFGSFSCINTSAGPTVNLRCDRCQLMPDIMLISSWFVDLPNIPATAVGFQFNFTAISSVRGKIMSFVSGILRNVSSQEDGPVTYRGILPNVFKFNLFPMMYRNLHDLKIVQPLLHEFIPGSYFGDAGRLRASVANSRDGLINITLSLNFLSSYIIEVENRNTFQPVSFLADLGGLYCISVGIFFYLLMQCEYRFRRLRDEENIMRKIRRHQKAREHWDKLRKYVQYTWGPSLLEIDRNEGDDECCGCTSRKKSLQQHQSCHHIRKGADSEHVRGSGTTARELNLIVKHVRKSHEITEPNPRIRGEIPPLPPPLEFGEEINASDLQENMRKLYEYNVQLRRMLVAMKSSKSEA